MNSGKLALIQDLELRAALARFKGLQLDVVEVLEYTNTFNLQAAAILGEFQEVRAQLSRVEAIDAAGQDLPTLSVGTVSAIRSHERLISICLVYTSDAADELIGVDIGCRRKNKKKQNEQLHRGRSMTILCVDLSCE